MTTKKTAPVAKSAGKTASKANTKRKAKSPTESTHPAKKMTMASGAGSTSDQQPAHGRVNDASDLARDRRLRKDLKNESGRSPTDRHRERLTAVEAEEDGVRDDDDGAEPAADEREAAVSEQDADDDRA